MKRTYRPAFDASSAPDTLVDLLRLRAEQDPDHLIYRFLHDGDLEASTITFGELDRRARAIGAWLESLNARGERALLLYPAGLDYIAAYFGCLYAGVTAVPAYPPRLNRPVPRIQSIVADSRASVALTTSTIHHNIEQRFEHSPNLAALRWLNTEHVPAGLEADWRRPAISPDTLAFLQYTSGSTSDPKGVMLSHGNLMHNMKAICQGFQIDSHDVAAFWLPSYHDMGLIGGVLEPIYIGAESTLMSPVAFLQRPIRWLEAMSRYKATITGAPNFAYELCAEKATPEQIETLDLSPCTLAFCGAEPIRPETLERFARVFAACGFRKSAFYPCYGMAEGTLLVSGGDGPAEPRTLSIDQRALERDRVVPVSPGDSNALTMVNCGQPIIDQKIVIANPTTQERCDQDQVGEIWVSGPSIAQGYWELEEETRETFRAHLAGTGEGPFLRTGDLGFLQDGELYVTGRLKDLIIINGSNHYPQDIELTVESSHVALQAGAGAAFSVTLDGREQLVIVQEVTRQNRQPDVDEVASAIRQAVSEKHDLQVFAIILIKPMSIPKTSSGKIQRRACKNAFLESALEIVGQWNARPSRPRGPSAQPTDRPGMAALAATQQVRPEISAEAIRSWLVARIAAMLELEPTAIDPRQPFTFYGLGSVQAVSLTGDLEVFLNRTLSPTLAWDYPTIELLASHLANRHQTVKRRDPMPASVQPSQGITREPIAIVGLSCRFPGAPDPQAFWELLRNGVDAISEVPPDRWNVDEFYSPDAASPGKLTSRWGGFLRNIDLFDPRFFGISPREAARMDPQQRLLLEVSWEALENALIPPPSLAGSRTGVFVGISSYDYSRLQFDDPERIDAYAGTGNAHSIAANRLSYVLDLRGPSMAVDTACSSSLVALHLACQSLRSAESDLALVGGVNLILTPELTITFSQARMLSPDGRCKTFDAGADGYVRGEGCGVIVVKRLSDAQRDGDTILALVRGSAVNQDGRSNGLTAPNGLAQQDVIRQALAEAQVSPKQIGYVEAHGTGTPLGDPIEMESLRAVLDDGQATSRVLVGSVKTNIGHLESAAGIAGLIKVILAMQNDAVPPHLHLKEMNPYLAMDGSRLEIGTYLRPWKRLDQPRFAGVSSFGFGGTNAHVILSDPARITASNPSNAPKRPRHILTLSAKTGSALRELAAVTRTQLAATPHAIEDIAFSANTGRSHFEHRVTIQAGTIDELGSGLDAFIAGSSTGMVSAGQAKPGALPKIAFLFTGQGSQYPQMGRQLYETQPIFRTSIDRCAVILESVLDRPLPEILFPSDHRDLTINQTTYTQPALFAFEYALAQMWRSFGIEPTALMGHSVGEYVAACLAGIFSLEDGLYLISERSRLMGALPDIGIMAAVFSDTARLTEVLRPYQDRVSIAAMNGPENTVISGERSAVQAVLDDLAKLGVSSRALNVSHAFHSPLMEPILGDFEKAARRIHFDVPLLPLVSNVTGGILAPDQIPDASYWRNHVRSGVRFSDGMLALAELGIDTYLEIGPAPVLLGMGKNCLPGSHAAWLPSIRQGQEDWQVLLGSLAGLYVQGAEVDWAGFDHGYTRHKVGLPNYPFQRERYWLEPASTSKSTNRGPGVNVSGKKPVPDISNTPIDGTSTGISTPSNGRSHLEHEGNLALANQTTARTLAARPDEIDHAKLLAAAPTERRKLLEDFLTRQAARVLGMDPAGLSLDQGLDTLGLDSLMAMELKNFLESRLEVRMPISGLLLGPTISGLITQILEQLDAPVSVSPIPPALPVDQEGHYPLTHNQQAMWLLDQLMPQGVSFNVSGAVRLLGELDRAALRRAFAELMARHAVLRTTFHLVQGAPMQTVHEQLPLPFEEVDASSWTEEALQVQLEDAAFRSFDLEHGPAFRVLLLRRSSTETIALVAVHHIVTDFWSMTLLGSETLALYAAEKNGVPAELSALPTSYADFVQWRNTSVAGPEGERHWEYWRKQLAGDLPVLNLPADRPRKPVQTYRGETLHLLIGADVTQRLNALATKGGATLYMALLAAFQGLLHRYSGQTDILVGSAMAGRGHPDLAGLMGYFVNPVAMRADFSNDISFSDLLERVRQTVFEALDHQDFPPALLAERLRIPHRDASRPPLFETTFIYEKAHIENVRGLNSVALGIPGTRMDISGLTIESMSLLRQPSQFDLTLMMAETGDGLSAAFIYNPDLFDRSTIGRLAGHFQNLLERVISTPEAPLSTIPLLSASEQILVEELNNTEVEYPRDLCLHQLIEEQAERTPDSIAVAFHDQQWTYRELVQYADTVADQLESLGVGPDSLVGVCVERSPQMLGMLIGIHKAGGAYLPLDPTFPRDRLAFMLADSAAPMLITQGSLTALFPEYSGKVLLLDDLGLLKPSASGNSTGGDRGNSREGTRIASSNLAYVLYTSGSTGKPKGVMIQHKALLNFLSSMQREPGLAENDTLLALTTLSFDIAGLELYLPLVTGAKVVIADRETASDPGMLMEEINRFDATVMQATPATWRMLIEAGWQGKSNLKILCGGEALPRDLAQKLLGRGHELWNLYGPTETTIWSTIHCVERSQVESSLASAVPIGRPIGNTQIHILDPNLQPVPIGVSGELYIAGDGLSRGYLNRPELTAERFISNPFRPASFLYKTGDVARYMTDGNIEFLGRSDQQVKVRGHRIETGEVETALSEHPGIRQVVVIPHSDGASNMRLIAYVTFADSAKEADADQLQAFLRQSLPDYMIPSAFVTLASFPLTPNGKVDRRALPSLSQDQLARRAEYAAPRSEDEQAVAAICAEVLGLERVGLYDNFFDLGGNSLVATRLIFQIQEKFQIRLPLVRLFEEPTVAGLAAAVADARTSPLIDAEPFGAITLSELSKEVSLEDTIGANGLHYEHAEYPANVLLTGATGFLGAYLLEGLLRKTSATVYCIVRAENKDEGFQRIKKNLEFYDLWTEPLSSRIVVIPGNLDGARFGLSNDQYDTLAAELDVIYHNGAMVNFVYPYHALKPVNVEATREVLRLASAKKLKPVHFVSSLSVFMKGELQESGICYEDADLEQIGVPFGGYGQSKWVSEGLMRAAAKRGVPITIFRPDNILGDRRTGILNTNDMTYSLVRAIFRMGSVPDVEIIGGIVPVDFVSDAMLHLSSQPSSFGRTFHLSAAKQSNFVEVFEMIAALGVPLRKIPFSQWKADYYDLARQHPEEAFHAFLPLINRVGTHPLRLPLLDLTNTIAGLEGSSITCPTVDTALVDTYVKHFIKAGLLSPARERER
jgi:amino acid adenylation domain-containing protein/thioester reductase-like protein